MTTRQDNHTGRAVEMTSAFAQRPLLSLMLAALSLAGAFTIALHVEKANSIEARLQAEFVEIDGGADEPDGLIEPIALSPESLRAAILKAADETQGQPLDDAWRNDLLVERSERDGEFIVELGGDGDDAEQVRDRLDGLITAFADGANADRDRQRIRAMAWASRRETVLQARIGKAKAAIVNNPFDPDLPRGNGSTGSEKLLRLMIDATKEAKATYTKDEPSQTLPNLAAGDDGADLAVTIDRLSDVLADMEAGRAVQLEFGTALKEAEAALTALRWKTASMTGEGGILNRPAVVILEPASAASAGMSRYLGSGVWPLFSVLAILGLGLAVAATVIACRLYPKAEIATGAFLDDPNWPLPKGARRELSVLMPEYGVELRSRS